MRHVQAEFRIPYILLLVRVTIAKHQMLHGNLREYFMNSVYSMVAPSTMHLIGLPPLLYKGVQSPPSRMFRNFGLAEDQVRSLRVSIKLSKIQRAGS